MDLCPLSSSLEPVVFATWVANQWLRKSCSAATAQLSSEMYLGCKHLHVKILIRQELSIGLAHVATKSHNQSEMERCD